MFYNTVTLDYYMSTVTAEKSIYEQKALEKANFKVKGRFNPKYSLYSVSITLGSLSGFKMKDRPVLRRSIIACAK